MTLKCRNTDVLMFHIYVWTNPTHPTALCSFKRSWCRCGRSRTTHVWIWCPGWRVTVKSISDMKLTRRLAHPSQRHQGLDLKHKHGCSFTEEQEVNEYVGSFVSVTIFLRVFMMFNSSLQWSDSRKLFLKKEKTKFTSHSAGTCLCVSVWMSVCVCAPVCACVRVVPC